MFFMGHDGGQPSAEDMLSRSAMRVLCQRFFLLNIMRFGMPIVLLHTSEFRDGKVRYIGFVLQLSALISK